MYVCERIRQGDSLSATLFNIVLEDVIRNSSTYGAMIEKSSQAIAYADDIAVIA